MVRANRSRNGGPRWNWGQWVVARETPGKWRVFHVWSQLDWRRERDFDHRFKRIFYSDPELRRAFFPNEGPVEAADRSDDAWVVRLGPADADAMAYALQVEEPGYPMVIDRFAEDITPTEEDGPRQESLW